MLPITQEAAGYVLLGVAVLGVVEGLAIRWFVRHTREKQLMRRLVHHFRGWDLTRLLFGQIEADVPTDEEIDKVILGPAMLLSVLAGFGGLALICSDLMRPYR